ncbi:DUF58 domain-containing protein [Hamadaea sp. NPDC051192]|uniref:DUF58 domain-containing protein n=1 Tax=Hamadaea sp. NPDC051192 TaxID=3154940 RepID=UPI0034181DF4
MRLTRRGVALLAGGIGCYLLGEYAGFAMVRMIGGAAVGAVSLALLLARFRPAVQISRTVDPERVERGRPALATLVVRNPAHRWLAAFTVEDRVGAETRRIPVRSLAPGAQAAYHYELPTGVRGRHALGPLSLSWSDPFGLVRTAYRLGGDAELWVDPRRHRVRAGRAGHPRHHDDGPAADRLVRGSVDLRAIREYVVGDEVRHLHWKASARTGRLMVREYADPVEARLTVLLDTRAGVLSAEQFEEAVEVAASLVYATLTAGQPCRLVTSSGVDSVVDGELRQARLLLDPLCLADQDAPDSAPLVPERLGATRPVGALVVIGGPDDVVERWRPDTVIRFSGIEPAAGVIAATDAADAVGQWNAGIG